ncbi:alpha/beta hydrolase [uncultured Paraglaciecola sp.]|uniref:alpha/beta hydrolase n=1 Tax=uncultured Paraglaciecola sp. TaxID=1765024 RepID=UPI0030DC9500
MQLHCYQWLPAGDIKAVIQIAHGMAEHGARYARLAACLNAQGLAVYANDHRGHGKSIQHGQALGHMADEDAWNKAVDDLDKLNTEIRSRHPNTPIILLGHSMGSFLTQSYLSKYGENIAAVALSASNGPPGVLGKIAQLIIRFEKLRFGKQGHSALMSAMTFKAFNKAFKPNRTEFDWLSRDNAEVDNYVADPLCGFECSVASWQGMLDALTSIASDQTLAVMDKSKAIYVISGTDDPVGEKSKGVKRLLAAYKKHNFINVTHKFYTEARHELFNETNRDEVTNDFIAWVEATLLLE